MKFYGPYESSAGVAGFKGRGIGSEAMDKWRLIGAADGIVGLNRSVCVIMRVVMKMKNKYGSSDWARVLCVFLLTSACLFSSVFAQQGKKGSGYLDLLMKSKSNAYAVAATNHAKQLSLILLEFEQDYGRFPGDKTAVGDLAAYKGEHANDYLGQLIAAGYADSEDMFYVKGGSATVKDPDNNTATKAKTLEAGECGFAYYKGQSTAANGKLPLLMTPMTGQGFTFDPKPFKGIAIVLHIDGSVARYAIDQDGDAVLKNGQKLFAGGADTAWGVKGPDAKRLVFPK